MTQIVSSHKSKTGSVPFLLRAVAILILVSGALGLFFYLTVTVYELAGRNFLFDFGYKNFNEQGLYVILFLLIFLNSGLVISAILLLRLKKTGMYLYGISFIVYALLSYLLQDDFGWTIPVIGLALFLTIFIYRKRLIN